MGCGIYVFKKPRGYILVLKFLAALSAVCTTFGFSTRLEFSVPCNSEHDKTLYVSIRHPFKNLKFENLDPPWKNLKCDNDEELKKMSNIKLPFDYSSTASLFATCAIVSMSFAFAILLVSMLADQKARNVRKVLVIEFGLAFATTLVWLALSSAWVQGALDLMHYLRPEILFKFLSICIANEEENLLFHKCKIVEDGTYDVLYASVILGFTNFFLWLCSLWFIYKEIISCPQSEAETDTSKGVGKFPMWFREKVFAETYDLYYAVYPPGVLGKFLMYFPRYLTKRQKS